MLDLSALPEFVKLGLRPKLAFTFWTTCLALLLIPLPEFLYAQKFKDDYGYLLGVVFIFFFVLWIVELFLWFLPRIYQKYLRHQELAEAMDGLNKYELKVLYYFLEEDCQTRDCRPDWAEVQSLIRKEIIVNDGGGGFYSVEPYSIQRKAWAYLKKHKAKFIAKAVNANPELKERQPTSED